ncbi:DUF6602 domain-containing protein [Deinococcus oregonensis]|uniref:DUF6602 domain-containing protein n=1 Tax=Deinococcus oregonensis TaxID=1805970 RepID=A0ABV6AXA3_9DEIO
MDAAAYYRSITQELLAVKDRVANVIDESHQGEIGSWRESLVRSLLRRHLPATMGVGQGFILTGQGPTTQLDVIVYDLNYPKIVQEGEFVVVTPDAVRAIVEVKSSTSGTRLRKDLRKLAAAAVLCRMDAPTQQTPSTEVFVGYFAFTSSSNATQRVVREALQDSVLHHPSPLEIADLNILPTNLNGLHQQRNRVSTQPHLAAINALALGPNHFIRH